MYLEMFPGMRNSKAVMAAVLLTSLSGLVRDAGAQQDMSPPDDGMPRYTVELIVFTYGAEVSSGSEIFVPDKPKIIPDADESEGQAPDESVNDSPPAVFSDGRGDTFEVMPPETEQGDAVPQEAPPREQIELHLLGSGEYTMDDIYRRLEQLDAYEPIMRAAWTQTTPTKEVSPAVHLRALGTPPAGLDGSITLYRGRYLHLVVDLALDAEGERGAMSATDRLVYDTDEVGSDQVGDDRMGEQDGAEFGGMLRLPVRYRIAEDRIMKTGEIRYYDHPRFGVIAKVTKPDDAGNLDATGNF
jgi:Peptidoglycan-binding protein, CsiV